MIVDAILDRRDAERDGDFSYNASEVLKYIYDEAIIFGMRYISSALDYGSEIDIKVALCRYIDKGLYNPDLKDYILSVNWLGNLGK